jgi:hypothetical protein
MTKTIEERTAERDALFARIELASTTNCANYEDLIALADELSKLVRYVRKLEKENKILVANCSKSVMRRLRTQTDIDFSEREDHEENT